MKKWLVGGAVRDELLGRPVQEKDWVVVGAQPEDLLREGYQQVGKDFPVFLHPKTREEYALARRERKTAPGYAGFAFDTAPTVTLEEDLARRDLTINAMAKSEDGEIIDPFHGQEDLNNRWLRHVSAAFVEDPVRILRVARFAARFAALGFRVAPETLELMKKMVASGEVDALVAERVWKEWERALGETQPDVFFVVLTQCGAFSRLFPAELQQGCFFLKKAVNYTRDKTIRFAVLVSQLNKNQLAQLVKKYRLPAEYQALANLVIEFFSNYLIIDKDKSAAEKILYVLERTDAFRRPERFDKWLMACEILSQENKSEKWQMWLAAINKIDINKIVAECAGNGPEIARSIRVTRLQKIAELLEESGEDSADRSASL